MTQHTSTETSKLLASTASPRPPPVNHAMRPTEGSGGGMLGTVRNVCLLVHGLGEQARGTILGAIDDWENNGERKHHDVAATGQAEISEAYRRLWGTAGPQAETQATGAQTTGYDAAPPSYNATTSSGAGTGGRLRPDVKHTDS